MLLLKELYISNFCNFSLVATCGINFTLIHIVNIYIYTQESVLKTNKNAFFCLYIFKKNYTHVVDFLLHIYKHFFAILIDHKHTPHLEKRSDHIW